ncbi:MAG: HU family DNA-binding protein [Bacteroidales bacterium]|nr:HU family DNA-binding protein [Bacteroidales bacterium]MBQ7710693.1 HU family DNA-binding protein [Bacteroidales bacterium]
MNKAELIAAMAENAGLTKVDAHKALDAFIDATKKELKAGNKLTLIGFGTFSVTKRKARTGLNPRTKKAIKIPAKKVVKFKAGKGMAL